MRAVAHQKLSESKVVSQPISRTVRKTRLYSPNARFAETFLKPFVRGSMLWNIIDNCKLICIYLGPPILRNS